MCTNRTPIYYEVILWDNIFCECFFFSLSFSPFSHPLLEEKGRQEKDKEGKR
jgi:hypothetical protein